MSLNDNRLAELVRAAQGRAAAQRNESSTAVPAAGAGAAPATTRPLRSSSLGQGIPGGGASAESAMNGVFTTLDEAARAAKAAFLQYCEFPLRRRAEMIERIRVRLQERVPLLSELAVAETGLGRAEDKQIKNSLVIRKTPGPEILRPESVSGDDGLMLTEWAPYGVIGSITPVTNPSETIINNGIAMLAAGNTVVFNPHPSAKNVSRLAMSIMNEAAQELGAPKNLLCCVKEPTLESAQALMHHKAVRLLVVTGGPGVVRAALDSGKKCITGGPGNPPAVVDETADIAKAARDITLGGGLDNGIICTCEKEIIVVKSVKDALLKELQRCGNRILNSEEIARLEKVIFEETRGPRKKAVINRQWVGKTARTILAKIGVEVPESCRLAILPVPVEHPLLWTEQLMPMMPLCAVDDAEEAMRLAVEMEAGNGHTFVMHSRRVDRLGKMARMCNASIFVKNGPNFAGLGEGGEGFTSFTIATPTGEGLTDPRSFSRLRRCTLVGEFRIV